MFIRNRQLRSHVAALLGENRLQHSVAKMSYDLRRLRLKGLIYRKPAAPGATPPPMA
jgi:hypothetical protein